MSFRSLRCCLLIILLLLLVASTRTGILSGQSQQPSIHVNVDVVSVLCSIFDKSTNSFVTNLSQEDFSVYENNQKQEITYFRREKQLPLTLAMLVDTSTSVEAKLKFEKDAANNFFQSVLRENDRALLLQFNTGVTLRQDFTNDPNKMTRQIDLLRAGGGTALYDAIYRTCDEKMIHEKDRRKAMVILSDGDDESSDISLKQATEMALRSETIIFAISVNKGGFFGVGGEDKEGDSVLKEIANETGGRIFFPFKTEDLDEDFRQIDQELRSQYDIGFVSKNPVRDGSYRKLEVKVSGRNYKLRYRKGYYAPAG
jgi:Ca-activated chloride channel homolog